MVDENIVIYGSEQLQQVNNKTLELKKTRFLRSIEYSQYCMHTVEFSAPSSNL